MSRLGAPPGSFTAGSMVRTPGSMLSNNVFGLPGRSNKSSFEDFNGAGNDKGLGFRQPNVPNEVFEAMADIYNTFKRGGVTYTPDGVSLPTVKYGQTKVPVIEEEALCICLYPMENAYDFLQKVFNPALLTDDVREIMYRRYETHTVNATYVSETGSGTGTSMKTFETTFRLKRISFAQAITEDAFYNTENGAKQFAMLLDALSKSYRDHFVSLALVLLQQHQAPTFRYTTSDPKVIAEDEYYDFIDNVGTFLRAEGNVFDSLSIIMSNKLSNAHLGKVDTVIYPSELDIFFKGLKRVVPMDGQTTSQALDGGLPGSLNRRGDNFQIDNFYPIPSERGPKSLTAMSRAIMTFFIRQCELTEHEAPVSLKWFCFSKSKIVDTTYSDIISKGFENYFIAYKPERSEVTRHLLKDIGNEAYDTCDIQPEDRIFNSNTENAKLSEAQKLIDGLDKFIEDYDEKSKNKNFGLRTFSDLPIKYYPTERFVEIARGFLLNNQNKYNENELRREIAKYRDFAFGPKRYSFKEQKRVITECVNLHSLAQTFLKDLDGPLVAEHDQMFDDYRRDEITAFFTYICLADCYPIGFSFNSPSLGKFYEGETINPDGYNDISIFYNDRFLKFDDLYDNDEDIGNFVREKHSELKARFDKTTPLGGGDINEKMLVFFENWFVDGSGNRTVTLSTNQKDVILKKMRETKGQFLIDFASDKGMTKLAGVLRGLKSWLSDDSVKEDDTIEKTSISSPGFAIVPMQKYDLNNLQRANFLVPSEDDFVNKKVRQYELEAAETFLKDATRKTKYKALFNAGLYYGTKLKMKIDGPEAVESGKLKFTDDQYLEEYDSSRFNYVESKINFVIPASLGLMDERLEEIDNMGEDMLLKGLAVIIMMSAFSKNSLINMAKRSFPPIINPPHISSVIILAHGINFCQSGGKSVTMGGTAERSYMTEDPVNHMLRYETRANIGGFRIPDSAVFGLLAPYIYKVIGLDKDEPAKTLVDLSDNMDINTDAKNVGWFTGLMPNIKDPRLGSTAPPFTISSKHSMYSQRPQSVEITHLNSMVPFWISNMDFEPEKLTKYEANTDNYPISSVREMTMADKDIPIAPLFVCQYMIPDNAVYEVASGGTRKSKNHTKANPIWPGYFSDNTAREIVGSFTQSVGNQALKTDPSF